MGRPPPEDKIALHTNGCLVKRNSLELNNIQEPQKNRATQKDPRQDEYLKKESSSSKILKKRSYKECFVSPSGKFFAWMKRSSDKVMRNFCTDWPQTKVLKKVHPRQISRTTSTGSIASLMRESPPRGLRCSVKSEISLSGNFQDFVRVICKSEKTAMNESMRCLGKKGRRSLSRDKLQKEDKNEAVRRREPRWVRPKRNSDISVSSSLSEVMETMDFDITSNSVDGARWQKSNEFHAQVFSCFANPEYQLDGTKHRRMECYRESDRARRKREKKERKAVKRLEKKTAKIQKTCEKKKKKLVKKEDNYASRCILEGCDFGKDFRRKHPPIKMVQTREEDCKDTLGEPYRPKVYKKEKYPYVRQPCREVKKLQEDTEDCSSSQTNEVAGAQACLPEIKRSVLSGERPSFERNTLRDFFKSFGWLYPKLEELCRDYPEKKKVALEGPREIRDARGRCEKDESPTEDADCGSTGSKSSSSSKSSNCSKGSKRSASEGDLCQRRHDPNHPENCDCVRRFLECQVEKKLTALRNAEICSKDSMSSISSKCSKAEKRKAKAEKRKRKKWLKKEVRRCKKECRKIKECDPELVETKPDECDDSRPKTPQSAMKGKGNCGSKKKKKVRHRNEYYCQYCGTTPCLSPDKHQAKHKESSASTQQGTSKPKEPCQGPSTEAKDNSRFLSYLCRLWRSKNRPTDLAELPPEPDRERCKVRRNKRRCRRCAKRRRNANNGVWRLEARKFPPEICIFKDDSLQGNRTGVRARAGHSHCFLINGCRNSRNAKPDLVCFPDDRRFNKCRPAVEGSCRRVKPIDCQLFPDSGQWTDKTTETEGDSCRRINRKNLKVRLASLHCLWRNLRRCTREKAMLGRHVGRCIRRSLSGLDSYDCWWSDTWPRHRRQRHQQRRYRRY